jgi:hypothetical protein
MKKILMMLFCFVMIVSCSLFCTIVTAYAVPLTICSCRQESFGNVHEADYYEVYVEAGKTLFITLDDTTEFADRNQNELYLKYGALPTLEDYDTKSSLTGPDQTIAVLGTQEGWYYVLAYNKSLNSPYVNQYTICANIQGECLTTTTTSVQPTTTTTSVQPTTTTTSVQPTTTTTSVQPTTTTTVQPTTTTTSVQPTTTTTTVSGCTNTAINDGLVAYYPFNGNANDESGNGNDGQVHGATLTADRFNNENSAYEFDGLNDYISFNPVTPLNQHSISVWIKPSLNSKATVMVGHTSGPGEACGKGFDLRIDSSKKPKYFLDPAGCGGGGSTTIESNIANDGGWMHLVGTYNGDMMSFYVDGQLVEQKTGATFDASTCLAVGAVTFFNGPQGYYNGILDDIQIYNRALTENEVQELYKGKTTCTDNDGDGYYAEECCGTEVDCDDTDPAINPGVEGDAYGDLIDNDCDGKIDEDPPLCTVLLVSPDEFYVGFGLLPRLKMVRIIGAGPDFDSQGSIVFSSDDVFVLDSKAVSKTEISALVYIAPRAKTGNFDVSVGDCVGKDLFEIKRWRWQ